jgi:hypothetical protein
MTAHAKRSLKPSPTGPHWRSRCTSLRTDLVLVKSMYLVAGSRRDGEAGPGSKCEAGYEEPSKCDQCMLIEGPGDGRPQILARLKGWMCVGSRRSSHPS